MFVAAVFSIAPNWMPSKYPSSGEWIVGFFLEHDSAIRATRGLHAATRRALKHILIPLLRDSRKGKATGAECVSVAAWGCSWGVLSSQGHKEAFAILPVVVTQMRKFTHVHQTVYLQ